MQMTIRFTVFFTEKYKETEYNFENSVTLPDLNELAMETMLSAVDFKNNHLFHNTGVVENCFVNSEEDFDEEDYLDDSEEDIDDEEEDYFDDDDRSFNIMNLQWQIPPKKF